MIACSILRFIFKKVKNKSDLVFYSLYRPRIEKSILILGLLSVCQVGDCCKLFLDGIGILKGIRYPNYKLSLIKIVLCVSYFISGAEI
nr:MAG TPA: hypothetical protein [Caudoviricetes sp.]